MKLLKYEELVRKLRLVGIQSGDIVHVHSDLRRIGPVDCKPDREAILEFYLSAFKEVLGENGTLTVPTGFGDYARFGTPFILESSPSRLGVFSEYVRTRPGTIRSMHPLVSISALGCKASEICSGPHFVGLGWDSPWGRLHRNNANILSLGLGPNHLGGMSFFHYIDNMYGVPYLYNKIFNVPVFANGLEISGPFCMSVRYLNYNIFFDTSRHRHHLINKKILIMEKIGRSFVLCGKAQEIFHETILCLRNDPYLFLKKAPSFQDGEIPMDGIVGPQIPLDGDGVPAQT